MAPCVFYYSNYSTILSWDPDWVPGKFGNLTEGLQKGGCGPQLPNPGLELQAPLKHLNNCLFVAYGSLDMVVTC